MNQDKTNPGNSNPESSYKKPLPQLTDENRPFWEAARNNELRLQKCAGCDHLRYPISFVCPRCLSEEAEWVKLSGQGTVFSAITFHQVYHPAYKGETPYNVSIVQLDEGPRLFSNVVGVPPNQVKVGDRVEVVFDPVTEDVTIPRFTPVRS